MTDAVATLTVCCGRCGRAATMECHRLDDLPAAHASLTADNWTYDDHGRAICKVCPEQRAGAAAPQLPQGRLF